MLGHPVIHRLGIVSYSIYLVHRPVEDIVRPALTALLQARHVPHVFSASAALTVMPMLLVSALTYGLVEQPFRAWSHRLLGPHRAGKKATAVTG